MKLNKLWIISLLVVGVSTQARATTQVIDQLQASVNTGQFVALASLQTSLQSFQQASDNISGAGIRLHVGTADKPALLTISLLTGLPSTAGVQTLATASAIANEASDPDGWFDVFWSNPVTITPDTTYFLFFDSDDQNSSLLGDITNPYARGDHYTFHINSGTYVPSQGLGFSARDVTFRTYTSVVPVPAAVWLFGSGLLGLIGIRKRSSKATVITA